MYYNPDNSKGCDKRANFTSEFTESSEDVQSPIYLVERGDCTFVTKTRNIAHAGGKLAIIIDSKNENITNVQMSDDGTGAGIRIPAVMIGRADGEKLKEYATKFK